MKHMFTTVCPKSYYVTLSLVSRIRLTSLHPKYKYEGWNFNSGNYLFTTDTK